MDTSGTTQSRRHLSRAYAFSLLLHVAVACAAVLLTVNRQNPAGGNSEVIFTIEADADVAGWPAESVLPEPGTEPQSQQQPPLSLSQSLPQPLSQAPVDSQIAVAPDDVAGELNENGNLLSSPGLTKIDIPDEDAGDDAGKKQPERENRLEEAGVKKPMVMVSSATTPASDPMDAYFTVFIQSIRDVYEKPGDLERQQQRQLSVRIRYEITADGTIGTVSIVRSSGSATYDQSVVKAFRSLARIAPRPDLRSSVNVADFCLVN
jgi:TonB family protein